MYRNLKILSQVELIYSIFKNTSSPTDENTNSAGKTALMKIQIKRWRYIYIYVFIKKFEFQYVYRLLYVYLCNEL